MEALFNPYVQFYLAAYLVGSIPFGLILAKVFAGVDVKASGSKSIGATNVLRVVKESDPALAKKLGIATLALDALKGVVVLLVAMASNMPESVLWAVALLAVIGHCFSIYLWFEGGKGIATAMGVMLVLLPLETLIGLVVWAIGAKVLKISSVSSLAGTLALLISSFYLHSELNHAPVILITFILFYKHIPNIVRLIKGEEKRVI